MPSSSLRLPLVSLAVLAGIIGLDASGVDLSLALLSGDQNGFLLRDHWFLVHVMHSGAKYAAWLLVLFLCFSAVWPVGAFTRLPSRRRVQFAVTALVATGLVSLLKARSHTSCPWDLHEFGGIARHLTHWTGWFVSDGGSGHCFPAGHASTGFAFLGGYFAFRDTDRRAALAWLAGSIAAGLLLGVVQQLRGAHFLSHTLWTGWLCWMAALALDPLFARPSLSFGQDTQP